MNNMTESHLKLVEGNLQSDIEAEFVPLPYYPWPSRPSHLPIEVEEAATALYLAGGLVHRAAERLKVEPLKLVRLIGRSARLQRLHQELASLLNDKVHEEYIRAFESTDDRRREWVSTKVSQTAQFQSHPLAPRADHAPAVTLNGPTRIIISWDDGSLDSQPTDADGQSGKLIEGEVARRGSADSGSKGDV
jgi:hypothetical protein